MKKIFLYLWLLIVLLFWIFQSVSAWDVSGLFENFDEWTVRESEIDNDFLNQFDDRKFSTSNGIDGAKWIAGLILSIAQSAKNLIFWIATLVFLVIVIKLLVSSNTEEESRKFRMWLIWIVVGIAVMQLSYSVVEVIFWQWANEATGELILRDILEPIIQLFYYGVAFVFLVMAIIAFYLIVTSNGDEEKARKWKFTILYALAGFIVVKTANVLVNASFNKSYQQTSDTTISLVNTLASVINWSQWFLYLFLVIALIYSGAQIITANGDPEKLTKARRSIIFIFIGLFILVTSWLIVTFLLPTVDSWTA